MLLGQLPPQQFGTQETNKIRKSTPLIITQAILLIQNLTSRHVRVKITSPSTVMTIITPITRFKRWRSARPVHSPLKSPVILTNNQQTRTNCATYKLKFFPNTIILSIAI